MMIQEASEDVTKGGIFFSSSKTLYIEANTWKCEETGDFSIVDQGNQNRTKHQTCKDKGLRFKGSTEVE